MARRSTTISIAASPTVTFLFRSNLAGGSDGLGVHECLVSCPTAAARGLEYQVQSPADPSAEWAQLAPGESIVLKGPGMIGLIDSVAARGIGGTSTGGFEVIQGVV